MTSPRSLENQKRQRQCECKRRYPDEPTVLAFIQVCYDKGELPLKHYRCRFCGGYHIAKDHQARRDRERHDAAHH